MKSAPGAREVDVAKHGSNKEWPDHDGLLLLDD
jgi:hypothetical protein